MTTAIVAGVTDAGHTHLEKLRVVGAVGFMAICAVFHYWRVFPKERPAALGMATQAVFIRGALNQLLWVRCTVGIVTAGACHLAFAVRHVRGTLQLRPPHRMALQAQLRL